jgi:Ca2+-binding RTX toxin-like protein
MVARMHQNQDRINHPNHPAGRARRKRATAVVGGLAALAIGMAAHPAAAAPGVTAQVAGQALLVRGTNGADNIAIRDSASGPATVEVDVDNDGTAEHSFDAATFAQVIVDGRRGDDTIELAGTFSVTELTWVVGGRDNDTMVGADGAEVFSGESGDDSVDGNRGNDLALLGRGNDAFTWDPGDGSDAIEGERGSDTMIFNGSSSAEIIAAAANGERLRFTRNLGNIVMDTDDLENVEFNSFGGGDNITVDDLTGTDVEATQLDLASATAGEVDTLNLHGTPNDDSVQVAGDAAAISATGLPSAVTVLNAEPNDHLNVLTFAGNDTIDASGLAADVIQLVLDGGDNDDTLLGGAGVETLTGAAGNDTADGNRGNDIGLLGAGNDKFIWDPGDGSDVVEGGEDLDTLEFNGAAAKEAIAISANGPRAVFFRDLGNITMDLDDTEILRFNGKGGGDTLTVGDMTGTDVIDIDFNLL